MREATERIGDSGGDDAVRQIFSIARTHNVWLDRVAAFCNAALQARYFILALRAVGLDCGPLSGLSNDKVDAAFFPDGRRCGLQMTTY